MAPPGVSEAPTETQGDEANPLLFAAYDLLTCTPRSASDNSAALPDSLLRFLNAQQQKQHRRTGGTRKPPLPDGEAEQRTRAKTGQECTIEHSALMDEGYDGQETFDATQPLDPREAGAVCP